MAEVLLGEMSVKLRKPVKSRSKGVFEDDQTWNQLILVQAYAVSYRSNFKLNLQILRSLQQKIINDGCKENGNQYDQAD